MFPVIYFVSNTEKVAGFYQKALGAKRLKPPIAQDYPPEEWIQVKTASVEIGFHKLSFLKARKRQPDGALKLVFKVPDVARKRRALQRMGVSMTLFQPLGESALPSGDVRQARAKTRQDRYAEARSSTVGRSCRCYLPIPLGNCRWLSKTTSTTIPSGES